MSLLSPAGRDGRLSIFIFHRVLPTKDALLPDEPDAQEFERLVAFISRHFRVLPLPDAAKLLRQNRLPGAAACITFDDGYADNRAVAAPILNRFGATATFFISTGYIDGGRMWNDTVIEAVRLAPNGTLDWTDLALPAHALSDGASRITAYQDFLTRLKYLAPQERAEKVDEIAVRAGLPTCSRLMMTRQQVTELQELGMQIGAHTVHHPILSSLNDRAAGEEIAGSRDQIAAWLGRPPDTFAYPNGVPGVDYTERDVRLVASAGFACAVSTRRGAAGRGADLMQLPRFTPWDRTIPGFAMRCAQTLLRH